MIGTEAADPQKGKIKHASLILKLWTASDKIRLKSSSYEHDNLGHANKHRKQKEGRLIHAIRTILHNSQLLE